MRVSSAKRNEKRNKSRFSIIASMETTEKQASLCLFQALFPEELHEKQAHHFVLVSSVVPTIVTRIERRRYSGNALVTQAIDSIL